MRSHSSKCGPRTSSLGITELVSNTQAPPEFNKVPGDAGEVAKHSIRSLAFLLQTMGATDGCRVRG